MMVMDKQASILEKLHDFNKLVDEARGLGLTWRKRTGFKDQVDAEKSLAAIESSLRAARGIRYRSPRNDLEGKVTDDKEVEHPDFTTLKDSQEVVDAYNALEQRAKNAGLEFVRMYGLFESLEAGVVACTELYDSIRMRELGLAPKVDTESPQPALVDVQDAAATQEEKQEVVVKKRKKVAAKPKAKKAAPAPKAKKVKAKSTKPKARKVVAKARKPRINGNGPRKGSQTEAIGKLLTRKSGCTAADVLELTGWKAVSMHAMAAACGLKLRQEKVKRGDDRPRTRYWGE
jgi:hypothetical protein